MVGVVQIMQSQVAEHDVDAVVRIIFVPDLDRSLVGCERFELLDQGPALDFKSNQLGVKLELE